MTESSRRLVRVQISQQLVEQFFITGYEITRPVRCSEGLPPGARLRHAGVADARPWEEGFCDIILTFEHESFATVLAGTEPPFVTPTFQYTDTDQTPSTA